MGKLHAVLHALCGNGEITDQNAVGTQRVFDGFPLGLSSETCIASSIRMSSITMFGLTARRRLRWGGRRHHI